MTKKNKDVPEAPVPVLLSSGKWAFGPVTTITCSECGAERVIKIQDAFQVTRCVTCQKKYQKARRNQKMKEANRAKREKMELERAYEIIAAHEAKLKEEEA